MEPTTSTLLAAILRVEKKLASVEGKFDTLIRCLGDEVEEVGHTIDGEPMAGERDTSQSLG